ncbi:SF1B family DNA helicase RecD2 [Fundicoccus culcitae]|uniref:ATP-dependent RecD2 DNA helicase n=1 Tax=Fundicoccus culcitae TaxID=2969821 RepID=A0ABY5P632_9LACT|nr:ATP-dependent RecD-like DNA helicase [Fundicoccus culcitae]UUX34036.1 ATP-dependent RecD-like DNA helicase [Fundicoccus culcitae]
MIDSRQEEEIVVGVVEAIIFENPSNLYKVIRVLVDEDNTSLFIGEDIVCTGQFATLHLDTTYEFYGQLNNHPKYGQQFSVNRYQQMAPTSEEGLIEYLSSHRFKGVGTVLASRIVETLGTDAIDKILSDSQALKEVPGLTQRTAKNLRDALIEHQGTERVYMQLNQWGFGPKTVDKIYQIYQSTAIESIKENPYELIEKIDGIGFTKADQLAESLGFEADAIERVMAGIITVVNQQSVNEGDTYVEEAVALSQAQKLLENSRRYLINEELLQEALDKAVLEKKLFRLAEGLMIPSLYYAEIGIAKQLSQYWQYEAVERFTELEIQTAIPKVEELTGITYDKWQKEALIMAINSPMSIITGGPGTGKTTLVQGLITLHSILHEYDLDDIDKLGNDNPVLLAAPTGRAAKRMKDITQLPASTIHRLIGFTRDTSTEDFHSNELEGSLLIIDEMSMVDTWLMNWLLQGIPYHMQVVFVGDQDQLPSVGPGKVFNDLINSKVIPTVFLTKIYRQAENSSIIKLAHAIRKNQLPDDLLIKQADRSFIPCHANQVSHVIHQIVEKAIPKGFNANNMQVLAPMYKGPAGINALNKSLQAQLNPASPKKHELVYFETIFRVGDKVLQLVNNAEENVFNGDVGKIVSIYYKDQTDSKTDEMIVEFDEKELTYKRSDFNQLTLAYCTSIHKAQGSEYPLVILPLVDQYSRMLRKDILYTAVTRAQSSLILLGDPNCFAKAVMRNDEPRKTFLADLLQVEFKDRLENISEDLETEPQPTPNKYQLTSNNYLTADPMIGMEGISPYDFLPDNLT